MKNLYYTFFILGLLVSCSNNNTKFPAGERKESSIKEYSYSKTRIFQSDSSSAIPNSIVKILNDSLSDLIIPKIGAFIKEWKDYTKNKFPFLCEIDFNGDRITDYSLILKNTKTDQIFVYAFISDYKKYKTYKVDVFESKAKKIGIILTLEKRGEWESVTEKKIIKNDGLTINLANESLTFSYYWEKGKIIKFKYD